MTESGTPPVAMLSRSLSPVSVSIEERNDPAAAFPARSIASTTLTPRARAATVRTVRIGSLNRGRNIKRKKNLRRGISGSTYLLDVSIAQPDYLRRQRRSFQAVCCQDGCCLLLLGKPSQKIQNQCPGRS